jgi:hypothetical protein
MRPKTLDPTFGAAPGNGAIGLVATGAALVVTKPVEATTGAVPLATGPLGPDGAPVGNGAEIGAVPLGTGIETGAVPLGTGEAGPDGTTTVVGYGAPDEADGIGAPLAEAAADEAGVEAIGAADELGPPTVTVL